MNKNLIKKIGIALVVYVVATFALCALEGQIIYSKVPARLPSLIVANDNNVYVFAEGTWTIEGGSDAFPIQTTSIRCTKSDKKCIVAQAYIGAQLSVDIDVNPILEWSDSQLVFVNDSSTCMTYYYTINWITKSGSGIRLKKKEATNDPACSIFAEEMRLTMKNGSEVWNEEVKRARPKILHSIIDVLLFWTSGSVSDISASS